MCGSVGGGSAIAGTLARSVTATIAEKIAIRTNFIDRLPISTTASSYGTLAELSMTLMLVPPGRGLTHREPSAFLS